MNDEDQPTSAEHITSVFKNFGESALNREKQYY